MAYVDLAGLPCLISVRKDAPNFIDLKLQGGRYPRDQHTLRGEGECGWEMGEGLWEGMTGKGIVDRIKSK